MPQQLTSFIFSTSGFHIDRFCLSGLCRLAAVLTQIGIQKRNEKKGQKLSVFGTLMSLRGATLAPDFVRALNYIDVVFYKNQKVLLLLSEGTAAHAVAPKGRLAV